MIALKTLYVMQQYTFKGIKSISTSHMQCLLDRPFITIFVIYMFDNFNNQKIPVTYAEPLFCVYDNHEAGF